jgi:RNA polymerase sigma factor (sigma-70 family)
MQEMGDIELLRSYADHNSEEAFAALVTRHVNLVYSAALRHVGNPHHAEEITQAVFIILARKAGQLRTGVVLSSWLYQAARLTAANFLRSEIQRARREQEAHMQSRLNESEPDVWPQLAPLLDAAMGHLGENDRNAVVLRFFENKKMSAVGAALGISEAAAKKKVNRAVEKLRGFFTKRGIVVPAAALTTAISANSVQAAPPALAKTATAVAFSKGATASTSTLTLIKGALKIMAWTKAKTSVVAGTALLLVAGTTTVIVVQHRPGIIRPARTEILSQMQSIKMPVFQAMVQYAQAHQDEIPKRPSELKPYLPADSPVLDEDHWEIIASGKLTPLLKRNDVVWLQEKNKPAGQPRIVGYTDGHLEYRP